MVNFLSRFRRDESGISLTEALIAFPIVLTVIATFVEAGYAVYQYNQTAKAVAVGARLAAVSDPLVSLQPILDELDGLAAGAPVPEGIDPVTCGAPDSAPACDPAGITRLIEGSVDGCDPDGGGVIGMCDVNPSISAQSVRVIYSPTGLGYVGRPYNPVVTVRVELYDLTFDFFFLGALLGLENIPIPVQSVTITSEDLSTTPLGEASGGT